MTSLEAIQYKAGHLRILNQLLLPHQSQYENVESVEDGWNAIRTMKVRGAPAIAMVGCLSLACELRREDENMMTSKEELSRLVESKMTYLVSARPTAVNIKQAAEQLQHLCKKHLDETNSTLEQMKNSVLDFIEGMLDADVQKNKAMGEFGAEHILNHFRLQKGADYDVIKVQILTHCNTGSLATAGYGTALGVVRSLHSKGVLLHAFCTESRPYNQGARLTAYELVHESIPSTLVCDAMCGWLMANKPISAVVVGADRVVANGDTANKIGTYQLAILALHHKVPFYVVAPTTSIDLDMETGSCIPIEERPHQEVTHIQGIPIAAPGIGCWNPSFDVTPASLITGGIVTEFGVFPPKQLKEKIQTIMNN